MMKIKWNNPPVIWLCRHLDKKVERMFVEYLEMRGIETSLAGFLQDYMTKKYSKEYAMWSERLKEILQSDPSLELNTSHQKVCAS